MLPACQCHRPGAEKKNKKTSGAGAVTCDVHSGPAAVSFLVWTLRRIGAAMADVDSLLESGDGGSSGRGSGGGVAPASWGSPGATANEKLYVRLGQPVEGCELEPFATLVLRGGQQVGGPGAALTFRWSRTTQPVFPCAFSRCKLNEAALSATSSAEASTPGVKSLAAAVRATAAERRAAGAIGGSAPPLQCLTCLRNGSTGLVQSVFCSSACLAKGWKEHSQYHENQAATLTARGGPEAEVAAENAYNSDPLDKDGTLFINPLELALKDMQRLPGGAGAAAGAAPGAGAAVGGAKKSGGASAAQTQGAVAVGASVAFAPYAPEEWAVVSTDRIFLPGSLDVGHRLRLEVTARPPANSGGASSGGGAAGGSSSSSAGGGSGGQIERAVVQLAETAPVLPRPPDAPSRKFVLPPEIQPPPECTTPADKAAWRQRVRRSGMRGEVGGASLRVCCWNVLAEIYASSSVYPYVPLWQLTWSYRGGVVLKELLASDCDIFALQEVQVRGPPPPSGSCGRASLPFSPNPPSPYIPPSCLSAYTQ